MTDHELLTLVAAARARRIYESDPDWEPIDDALRERGFDLSDRAD
ncbi:MULTISPECIES: hypothetical protein [unclassified Nocardioides]|nr:MULTISPECIES: hypothetical protein [unclassified Nocardioides]GAW50633.1 uncharacterized protein PD653B2_2969 [Nocardioides sp. PD653-B2]GAW55532.1 uncharacterized protein PD653_2957 [Nocardioides sp. PD653]